MARPDRRERDFSVWCRSERRELAAERGKSPEFRRGAETGKDWASSALIRSAGFKSGNGGVDLVVSVEWRGVRRGRRAKVGSVCLQPFGRSSEPFRAPSAFAAAILVESTCSAVSNGPGVRISNSSDDDDGRIASSPTRHPSTCAARSGHRRTRLEGAGAADDDDGGVGHVSTTVGG